jgi:hypothetical protein
MRERDGAPILAVLGAGLLLPWPAALNGYPLVFADSGTYLGQAILLYLGWDRPAFYSLFLHGLHWRTSLWPIPVAQGLIAAHLLALTLQVLGRPGSGWLLGLSGLLAVGTGLPWAAAQIMPDVFTGLLVLALWLIGFGWDKLRRFERAYLLLFAAGAIAIHLSHLPLALGLTALGALLGFRDGSVFPRALRMVAPAVLAMVALVSVNTLAFGRPSLSPFGSVFLAARLLEDGPALRTTQARCDEGAGWRICGLLDRLPMPANDFLWPTEGPLREALGGGKAWAGEAREIVTATLSREPGAVAQAAIHNTLLQFRMLGTGDGLNPWPAEHGPEPLIEAHFAEELAAYRGSRQASGALERDVAELSPIHQALAWAGLFCVAVLVVLLWRQPRRAALCAMVLAAAIGNAAITGALSGANQRYQARIAWLFVLAPAAVLISARRSTAPPAFRTSQASFLRAGIPRIAD